MLLEMEYYAGCDVGSTTGKAVILDGAGSIVGSAIVSSKVDPTETAHLALDQAIQGVPGMKGLDSVKYLVGTGYGRNEIPFANENCSEISCHAMGAYYADPGIRTIIDIGGQDVKGIAVDEKGGVAEFVMNEKCAAGTGRFFEMMSRLFDVSLEEFSDLSLKAQKVIQITSQCSVFAESEVINLIARRNSPADIAAGIQMSVAKRVFSLSRRVGMNPKFTVTGGCAKNRGLLKAMEKVLKIDIVPLKFDPQLIGALGAAVMAKRKCA
jgi:predicted CoA-substrate-specific enzyme activase